MKKITNIGFRTIQKGESEKMNDNVKKDVTYKDKQVGHIKGVKYNSTANILEYEIEITDKNFIETVLNQEPKELSLGYIKGFEKCSEVKKGRKK